jgi:hypothetical protein
MARLTMAQGMEERIRKYIQACNDADANAMQLLPAAAILQSGSRKLGNGGLSINCSSTFYVVLQHWNGPDSIYHVGKSFAT